MGLSRDGSDDTAVVVDPGTLNTNLAREYLLSELHLLPGFLRPPVRPLWKAAIPWLLLPAEDAAENNMYAATATAREVNSDYTASIPKRHAPALDSKNSTRRSLERFASNWQRANRSTHILAAAISSTFLRERDTLSLARQMFLTCRDADVTGDKSVATNSSWSC